MRNSEGYFSRTKTICLDMFRLDFGEYFRLKRFHNIWMRYSCSKKTLVLANIDPGWTKYVAQRGDTRVRV
ncbi:hypothetical protein AM571_PB00303 (plasmid) [Rhizobium etli 8C-3]|uniref:Uncharacterized protein n=1 Tax=Rhizobium etli 8C-3 TaxID=538025 RepID=A0A1L5PC52_RHIET|nr:hypothetical protein AM571_PB00303 [Rhizobium etli 8C-3]